jgi:hypothetical protein
VFVEERRVVGSFQRAKATANWSAERGGRDGRRDGWKERKGDQRVCVVYIGLTAANASCHVTSRHVM